jgi:hypothetical protein
VSGGRPPQEPADAGAEGERSRAPLAQAVRVKQRAQLVNGLRGFARARRTGQRVSAHGARSAEQPVGAAPARSDGEERCDLCATTVPEEHRHLLNLVERRIECVCESCWALRSGDAEFRPTGSRTLWLADLELPEQVWAGFQIPIGLAFFMESSVAGCVVALYPSPAGATESELHFSTWSRLVALNPVLAELEPDVEGLIVNRLADPPVYAIAPIDRCYALTGTVKASWDGISGGAAVEEAVAAFFDGLRSEAITA